MLAANTLLHNRYLIIRQLGQGGMGAVYLATDQTFGSTVALKETLIADELLRKAFEREARLLNSLHHAALPHVFDYFFESEGQFLVMQFIPGEDLGQHMKKAGRGFDPAYVLKWADQLLDALDYLHSHEPPIVHRDIKPENLKLTQRGDVILLDFGLAKGAVDQMTLVSNKSLFGYTPHYAPFEQVRGTGTDPRSDLYSLAATIFHLLTATLPPDALTRAECALNGEPDPLANLPAMLPMVPSQVSYVLQRALAQKRDNRFVSAREMRAALSGALAAGGGLPQVAPIGAPLGGTLVEPPPPPPPPPAANPWAQVPTVGHSHNAVPPLGTPSNPQGYPSNPPAPGFPSNPPAPAYPSQPPAAQPHPGYGVPVSVPPTQPQIQGAMASPVPAAKSGGTGKLWFGLAVIGVLLVAIFVAGGMLAWPILFPATTTNVNSNTANTNSGAPVSAKGKTLVAASSISTPSVLLETATTPDGKFVVSSGEEKCVRIWQSSGGSQVRLLEGHGQPAKGLAISPDGSRIAAGSDDGTVRIWKTSDGTELASTEAHQGYVFAVEFSPDGTELASAGSDKEIKLWNSSDLTFVSSVSAPSADDLIVTLSPDLKWIAYFTKEKGVNVWSTANDSKVSSLTNHSFDVSCGVFSNDGTLLAIGSGDGVTRLWNAKTGALVREVRTGSSAVRRVRFSPDGSLLVTGAADGTIQLWSVADGAELSKVAAHKGAIRGIAFSSDGKTVVTGSADKTIRIWTVADGK
ncbi:MAG: protein kinase [Acidobacteria bacterium]|nr:protein kinase [Acidobacteriota bacterium]